MLAFCVSAFSGFYVCQPIFHLPFSFSRIGFEVCGTLLEEHGVSTARQKLRRARGVIEIQAIADVQCGITYAGAFTTPWNAEARLLHDALAQKMGLPLNVFSVEVTRLAALAEALPVYTMVSKSAKIRTGIVRAFVVEFPHLFWCLLRPRVQ